MAEGCSNVNFHRGYPQCTPPLRVCIDNEADANCTLIRVEGEYWHGVLLKIVEVLSDLDLIISKASISSDTNWFMDVFHVIDRHGHKVRDPTFLRYLQVSLDHNLGENESSETTKVIMDHNDKINVENFSSDCIVLELSSANHPDIFSEISTVLFQLSCIVDTGEMWTHDGCVASIFYIRDQNTGRSIYDRARLSCLLKHVVRVVETHNYPSKLWGVRLRPTTYHIHTERRLHQLMQEYKDYEMTPLPTHANEGNFDLDIVVEAASKRFGKGNIDNEVVCHPQISIDGDYWVVIVMSRDKPKIIFDAMCSLTDLSYDVLHGSISSEGLWMKQEYFVRRTDGCAIFNEMEKHSLIRSLRAAVERRHSQGLKMEVHTTDRHGLLLDISKVFRQYELSMDKAEFAKQRDLALGTFYISHVSSSSNIANAIDQQKLEAVRNEIDKCIFFKKNDSSINSPARGRWNLCSMIHSLRGVVWSRIKSLFSIFSFI